MIISIIIFILVLTFDQISKFVFVHYFPNLVYYNSAVAFSLPIPWYLPWVIISILILIMLFNTRAGFVFLIKSFVNKLSADIFLALSVGLIVGGGFGNLIDRFVRNGIVVDFIDLKFWPVFNIADSAIVCGVLLFVFKSYIKRVIKNKI